MMSIEKLLNNFQESGEFSQWGYSELASAKTYEYYKKWIDNDLNGPLSYLEGDRGIKRESLLSFYPQFKSSLVFTFSYAEVAKFLNTFYKTKQSNGLKIASYAVAFEGIDYHHYIRDKLIKIYESLANEIKDLEYCLSLDIHPVLERDLAVRSGLGWFGKNSMFITPTQGSFLMIGSLLLSKKLPLEVKPTITDHCGSCTRCIESCPTDAIFDNRSIDASKCISTFTIEQFSAEAASPTGMERADGEIFGCDICQNVCPWNSKKFKTIPEKMIPLSELFGPILTEDIDSLIEHFESISNRQFKRVFKATALERTGRVGLLKNLYFWKKTGRF